MQLIPKKAADLPRFYGEVLKKTTDAVRTLTGRDSLRIWEDRVGVMLLPTLERAIERLVYLFCNPSAAGLCDSIDTYKGISSWKAFCSCEAKVDAKVEINAPWHRVKSLPTVGARGLSKAEDERYAGQLCSSKTSVPHTLVYEPLAWLKLFGITEPKMIEAIRKRIINEVREQEEATRTTRRKEKRPPMTPQELQQTPYLKPHKPKKKERKIFVLSEDKEERIRWITLFRTVDEICNNRYANAKKGIAGEWPAGTFVPWLPPTKCHHCRI